MQTTTLRFNGILGEQVPILGTSEEIWVCFIADETLAAQVCPDMVQPRG
jgi:hypothetical protein